MVKKWMVIGILYIFVPIQSMQYLQNIGRMCAAAYYPWQKIKEDMQIRKMFKEKMATGEMPKADDIVTGYVHQITGDPNVNVVVLPEGMATAGAAAARDPFDGTKTIYITPGFAQAIKGENNPLDTETFAEEANNIPKTILNPQEAVPTLMKLYDSSLTASEVDAVLTHEYQHIGNYDRLRKTLGYALMPFGIIGLEKACSVLTAKLFPRIKPNMCARTLGSVAAGYCYYKISPYLIQALQREVERQADTGVIKSDTETVIGGCTFFDKTNVMEYFLEGYGALPENKWLHMHPRARERSDRCFQEFKRRNDEYELGKEQLKKEE